MIVCENGNFKIPSSYYLIDSLSGLEKAKIVTENLIDLHETGITVTSLTFDGLKSNKTMCKKLGATWNEDTGDYYFPHPVTKDKVYIIYDGCHALKLVRNAFSDGPDFIDAEGRIVSWQFIKELEQFQVSQGLKAANNLKQEHIEWKDNKMNVRIAAQTLSNSVSTALRYCQEDLQLPQFANAEGTAKFCSVINDAFDILNSRDLYNKDKLKEGISEKNIDNLKKKVKETETYIKNLKYINGISVLDSERKTGFEGMIISLKNVIKIYDQYYKNHGLYLLTYKLSQDHLEIFFSAVRNRQGNNNNPSCYQFINTFKRLLIHADIKGSEKGNCAVLDNTKILCISEDRWKSLCTNMTNKIMFDVKRIYSNANIDYSDVNFYGYNTNKKYIDDVTEYMAGFIARKLLLRSKCLNCPFLLVKQTSHSDLLNKKDRGGLAKPSQDLINICRLMERHFRTNYVSKRSIFKEICQSMCSIIPKNLLVVQHSENPKQHRADILKNIMLKYFLIRAKHFESTNCKKRRRIRRKCTKLVTFCHE